MTWGGFGPSGTFWTPNENGVFDWEYARGDVSGVIDNLIVIALRNYPIAPHVPIEGYVLGFSSGNWRPVSPTASSGSMSSHNLLGIYHADTLPASPIHGDIIHASGSPAVWTRFPLGNPGQFLAISSGGSLEWSYGSTQIVMSSGSTISLGDFSSKIIIKQSGSLPSTVNLPLNPRVGQEVLIKDGAGNANLYNITVMASGYVIDGLSNIRMTNAYQSYTFLWNGQEWNIT